MKTKEWLVFCGWLCLVCLIALGIGYKMDFASRTKIINPVKADVAKAVNRDTQNVEVVGKMMREEDGKWYHYLLCTVAGEQISVSVHPVVHVSARVGGIACLKLSADGKYWVLAGYVE